MKKIFIYTIVILMFFIIIPQTVYASDTDNILKEADSWLSTGEKDPPIKDTDLKEISDKIFNILLGIGTVITVIIAVVLGIQFMTGSIEEQAKVKESLKPFIIGCVILFGSFTIWSIVINVGQNISSSSISHSENPYKGFDSYKNSIAESNNIEAAKQLANINIDGKSKEELEKLKATLTEALTILNRYRTSPQGMSEAKQALKNKINEVDSKLN